MVVVAIVGIVSTIAVVMINRGPGIGLVATELGGAVGEASRKAVSAGPVTPSVVAAEGFTARSRVFIDEDENGNTFYAVELRRESGTDASEWEETSRSYIPSDMAIAGAEAGVARTEPGGTVVPIPADGFAIDCQPSGQCAATTVYLHTTSSQEQKRRVVIMPLSANPLVLEGW